MQRLFSTFPNSWPGLGLLLLRISIGYCLLVEAVGAGISAGPDGIVRALALAAGVLIVIGLWTPIMAGVLIAILVYQLGVSAHLPAEQLLRLAVYASIGLLGPGAWSLDSRLFGRKRIAVVGRGTD